MGYGARAKRVPASGGGGVSDVDFYKLGILGQFERGISAVQKDIYSENELERVVGGFDNSNYSRYVMRSFYDVLNKGINVETVVKMHVASDAVQASAEIDDTAGSPLKIFDIKAGFLNAIDKSAFGNKIGYKIEVSENVTFKLQSTTSALPTTAILDQVEGLAVGHVVKFDDGVTTEYAEITAINEATKTITFAALTNDYVASITTVYRQDWSLLIAVKDSKGVFQLKESWLEQPFAESDSVGMAKEVNDTVTGSAYVTLAVASNATAAGSNRPAAVTTWTALSSGSDGTAAGDSDWLTDVASLADENITIMLAPESSSITHNENMANYATDSYKWMYYGQGSSGALESGLKNLGASIRTTIRFGMLPSDKWLKISDPTVENGILAIPPVGYCAAHYFNSYETFGVGKVAAGNREVLQTTDELDTVNDIVHNDIDGQGERLIRKYSVNIARYRKGKGITLNSARTLSTDDGYKWQHQVMMWLLIKRSIVAYLTTIEQDGAGRISQESHYNAVWSYLNKQWDNGLFYDGQKSDGSFVTFGDVVQIVNDFSVNTLADINNGIENVFVQFIAKPVIEEPILSLASAGVTTVRG